MRRRSKIGLGVVVAALAGGIMTAAAVSGAAFTTFNAHVDGATKDVCKNSAVNCSIYGAKEYVWLNGGPTANGLGPDGDYFFAVLEPGGQPNPNDRGSMPDKNLSDDYDCYQNRIFTVTNGEVSAYTGNYDCSTANYPGYTRFRHWLDDGKSGPKPNWKVPYIRLYPYADTSNPDGVYIMSICSLENGYPVDPRDCKYDAFKVKKGKLDFSFYLQGMTFDDVSGNAVKDATDPGLPGWGITVSGTGPDGLPISTQATTGTDGYWQYQSPVYTFPGTKKPVDVNLTVCEVAKLNWVQTFPTPLCHTLTFTPTGFDSFFDLDSGNTNATIQ